MNIKHSLKNIFNLIAEDQTRPYTIWGMLEGETSQAIPFPEMRLTRAARFTERAITLTGIFAAAVFLAPMAAMVAVPAFIGLGIASKAAGLAAGLAVDTAVEFTGEHIEGSRFHCPKFKG